MNSNVLHLSRDGFSVISTLDAVICMGICLSSVWSAGPTPGGVQKLWSSKSKTNQVFLYMIQPGVGEKCNIKRYLLLQNNYDAFDLNKEFMTNHFSGEAWTH